MPAQTNPDDDAINVFGQFNAPKSEQPEISPEQIYASCDPEDAKFEF
jgi:hypothetical protein